MAFSNRHDDLLITDDDKSETGSDYEEFSDNFNFVVIFIYFLL